MDRYKVRSQSKIIVANSKDEILLLRRKAGSFTRPLEWDLPGGHVELGEDLGEAAARELFEESGINVPSESMYVVYALTEIPSENRSVTWITFFARSDSDEVAISDEHSEFCWVSIARALQLVTYERQLRSLQHAINCNLLHAAFE